MAKRLNIRIDDNDKDKLKRAAKVERRSLSGFIKAAALERAERVLSRSEGDQGVGGSSDSE